MRRAITWMRPKTKTLDSRSVRGRRPLARSTRPCGIFLHGPSPAGYTPRPGARLPAPVEVGPGPTSRSGPRPARTLARSGEPTRPMARRGPRARAGRANIHANSRANSRANIRANSHHPRIIDWESSSARRRPGPLQTAASGPGTPRRDPILLPRSLTLASLSHASRIDSVRL